MSNSNSADEITADDLKKMFDLIESGVLKMGPADWDQILQAIEKDDELIDLIQEFSIKHDKAQHILISK